MNLLFRLIRMLITAWLFGKRDVDTAKALLEPARVTMRCWPTDMDLNFHMNNGRYLSIMDLGRVDMMLRAGFLTKALKRGWMPVVAASTMRYRRAIGPFERFQIETQIIGWDEKWVYIEQRFYGRDGRVKALGLVQTAVTSKQGRVPTAELMEAAGVDLNAVASRAYVEDWTKMLADWPVDPSVKVAEAA